MAQMESLGLPTGFSFSHATTVREAGLTKKGDKKSYYCQTCLIDLNSEDTMKSHLTGKKHMMKQIQVNQKIEEKRR